MTTQDDPVSPSGSPEGGGAEPSKRCERCFGTGFADLEVCSRCFGTGGMPSHAPLQGDVAGLKAAEDYIKAHARVFAQHGQLRPDQPDADVLIAEQIRHNTFALAAPPSPSKADVGALMERSGVYVASRASLPERGQMWRDLRAAGVPINSTWIDEDGPKASRDLSGLWSRIVSEVSGAERLVLYVEPGDFPLKGALIEIGAALAAGVPVMIVAPGVELEPRNCRPLGSWIKHPLVSFADTVETALASFTASHDGGL